jgi:beta-lactamase superfamily II metal-dependent hydrolase
MLTVKFLRALHGDAVLVTCKSQTGTTRILIDGGPPTAFRARRPGAYRDGALKSALDKLRSADEYIDLLVLTHIDDDHIGGLLKAFEHPDYLGKMVRKVLFNSGQLIHEHFKTPLQQTKEVFGNFENNADTSVNQGVSFEKHITNLGIWDRCLVWQGTEYDVNDVKLRFLSPNLANLHQLLEKWEDEQHDAFTSSSSTDYNENYKSLLVTDQFCPDKSVHNGSSLAFILEHEGKRLLLLGDAFASTVNEGLQALGYSNQKPLKVNLVKLSHHGSSANTDINLLSLIDSDVYVISTDGSRHGLPNKRTLARVHAAKPVATIYFNYPELINRIYSPDEINLLDGRLEGIDEELCVD